MITKEEIQKLTTEELEKQLKTTPKGLASGDATSRLKQYGPNILKGAHKANALKVLLKQFKSSLIYLLLAACIVSFLLQDYNDGFVIAIILFINTSLGFIQEFKSEKAVAKLQKLVGKEVLVRRDEKDTLISEKLLVPGDLLILREGDIVPADVRLIGAEDFTVNESQLTGESAAVRKTTTGKESIVFAGSVIEEGEARGFVYATGLGTELGKIAHLSGDTVRVTQYEKSLASFSSFLIKLTFVTLLIVFVFKLVITQDYAHITSLALFMVALSIAVVPEAMPVIATVTLSNGALKLAKRHVIAKNLSAIEDLGNINILCSDKTGTLTENKQTVKELVADDPSLFQHLAIASLENLDEKRKKFQSSFDRALLAYVPKTIQEEARKYRRLGELPFDPQARRRRVVFEMNNGKTYLVAIGSAETILKLSDHTRAEDAVKTIREDGKLGLRHLAIAYREVKYTDEDHFDILKEEHDLKFVGFVSLEDPLRPSARHTIKVASRLGVALKILSGDSREVTEYVAREVGLVQGNQKVYTGDELEVMSDLELAKVVKENNAFAHMNPEQKYRVINILKLSGDVVGYQGDGINDAPSLKLADVAIAVNNATDVARESADILLLRDDLNVIINGIEYGRGIFANINKYIRYTMIGNFGNFFALSALYLLSADLPLLTTQLLLTNLLGDVPLVAISTDNVETTELMRPSKYDMRSLIFVSAVLGTYTAIFEILYFVIIRNNALAVTQTSLFLYLTILGLVVILSVRNHSHFWKAPALSKPLILAFGGIGLLTVSLTYFKPSQDLFSFTSLPIAQLGLVFGMTLLYFAFLDLIKVWFYKTAKALML